MTREAESWKEKATSLSRKLAEYRSLRERAERVFGAWLSRRDRKRDPEKLAAEMEELGATLHYYDQIDPPRNFFKQTIEVVPGRRLDVAEETGLENASTLAIEPQLGGDADEIRVSADLPPEGQFVALLFQLVQYVDVYSAHQMKEVPLPKDRIALMASGLGHLLAKLRLLDPEMGVGPDAVFEYDAAKRREVDRAAS